MRVVMIGALLLAGCLKDDPYVCRGDSSCVGRAGMGSCVASGYGGESYCAIADATCPGLGLRWDTTARTDLASQCQITAQDLSAVWGTGSDVFIVGAGGLILHSGDHGSSWNIVASGTQKLLRSIWIVGAFGYAVGEGNTVLRTGDGGATWSARPPGTSQSWFGVWGNGANEAFLVGGTGSIVHTTDGGMTWTSQTSGVNYDLDAVWGSGFGDLYAVGLNGTILHTSDAGANWSRMTSGTSQALAGIWGSSETDIYIVGPQSTLLHSGDGEVWVPVSGLPSVDLNGVAGSGAGDIWAVGHGAILHSAGNAMWSAEQINGGPVFTSTWKSPDGNFFAVGRGGLILHR